MNERLPLLAFQAGVAGSIGRLWASVWRQLVNYAVMDKTLCRILARLGRDVGEEPAHFLVRPTLGCVVRLRIGDPRFNAADRGGKFSLEDFALDVARTVPVVDRFRLDREGTLLHYLSE